MSISQEAHQKLVSMSSAGGATVAHKDSDHALMLELDAAGLVKSTGGGPDWDAWKVMQKGRAHITAAKTTDSATPAIVPVGSRTGLIPPAVTEDPRIVRTDYTKPR